MKNHTIWHTLAKVCTLVICSVGFAPVQAALIPTSDAIFGNNSITRDTTTGLEWLDITFSVNQSYNFVSTQFASGGAFAGFRHATDNEVETLFINAGIPNINRASVANIAPAIGLISLVGATSFQSGNPEAIGITATVSRFGGGLRRAGLLDFFFSNGTGVYEASTNSLSYSESFGFDTVGHWLVRTTPVTSVPEPFTSYLVLSACASFGVLTARKKGT